MNISELANTAVGTHSGVGVPTDNGEDLSTSIYNSLLGIHREMRNLDASDIEIEVRMGLVATEDYRGMVRSSPGLPGSGSFPLKKHHMRGGLKFVSGVSPPDYETIKHEIGSMYSIMAPTIKEEVVYIYNSGDRVIVDGSKVYSEKKTPLEQVSLKLPAASYDLRVQVSREVGNTIQTSKIPGGWTLRRTKKRVSYESPESDWRVDMTLVDEMSAKGPVSTWEVELELLSISRDKWVSISDPEKAMERTHTMATQLTTIMKKINPMEERSSIVNPVEETRASILLEVTRIISEIDPSGRTSFPGSQPANMRKKDVTRIQSVPYFVAEKTDGVRYLMMTIQDPSVGNTCVLVNRSMKVFRVDGGEFLAEVLGMGTILDGELVHNRTSLESVFIAFDILQDGFKPMMPLGFLDRLSALQRGVMNTYRVRMGDSHANHLPLAMKSFYPRNKIMDLFRYISVEGRHRVFKNESLHHKTDGIIFQPNLPYTSGTDTSLLKWKWTDLASVDLKVYMDNGELKVLSVVGKNTDIDLSSTIHLSVHDRARLIADIGCHTAIVEMALDQGSGVWVYMGLRRDKDRANAIKTVMSTMIEVSEGISEDEMKYRMMSESHSSDDWNIQETAMRKKAVQWKHEQVNDKKRKR